MRESCRCRPRGDRHGCCRCFTHLFPSCRRHGKLLWLHKALITRVGANNSRQTVSVSIPSSLRSRFLVYGPRATSTDSDSQSKPPEEEASRNSSTSGPLDYLATWRVPHSYFTQFYIASVISSILWAVQLLCRGSLFEAIASRVDHEHRVQTMSLTQVLICWILLAMQGSRRLWESYCFAKPSTSKMWFVHWLLGLGFYLAAGVAIWIEGSGMDNTDCLWCVRADLLTDYSNRGAYEVQSYHGPPQNHQSSIPANFSMYSAFLSGLWDATRLPSLLVLAQKIQSPGPPNLPRCRMPALWSRMHHLPITGDTGCPARPDGK